MGFCGCGPTEAQTVEHEKTGREKKRPTTLLTGATGSTGSSITVIEVLITRFVSRWLSC